MALFEQQVQYLDRNNKRLAFVCACSRVVHTMVTNSFPFILAIRHECFNKVDFRLGNNTTKANGQRVTIKNFFPDISRGRLSINVFISLCLCPIALFN